MKSFDRTEKLIGADGLSKLISSTVMVVGLGGVGGYVFETLLRAGIGRLIACDFDVFEQSNINRQLLADLTTIGMNKAEAASKRAAVISPDTLVTVIKERFSENNKDMFFAFEPDYIADAIDSVADKAALITEAGKRKIPIVSAMGAGNRLTADFAEKDIYSTSNDGLAKALRKRLDRTDVPSLKTICALTPGIKTDGAPASISYPPAIMGCMMAEVIVKDLLCR